ncbi:MAG: hypothetical protein ABI840_05580, partial [bacterium]
MIKVAFIRKHWKVFLPIAIALCIALITLTTNFFYFLWNRNFPILPQSNIPQKAYIVIFDKPIINLVPLDFRTKAPLNRFDIPSVVFLPNNIDTTNSRKIEYEVTGNDSNKIYRFKDFPNENFPKRVLRVLPKITFNLKLKNIGSESAQIIIIWIGSEYGKTTYLRDDLYKKQIAKIKPFEDFKVKTLLPGDTLDYFIDERPLLFPIDSLTNQCVIHFLIVYSDGNHNFYDTYSWFKYNA